ncbi:hypothetical protein CEXT_271891 [Caerostris extrusa]|uniref:Uncharacterized protein n=1 Tax=Caerostris extrusa TaxID=172846 RepID=A0AAV4NQT6_CAEEX|nr:hypothetical protein CEXT_271891 [Caerostris extrusa]
MLPSRSQRIFAIVETETKNSVGVLSNITAATLRARSISRNKTLSFQQRSSLLIKLQSAKWVLDKTQTKRGEPKDLFGRVDTREDAFYARGQSSLRFPAQSMEKN